MFWQANLLLMWPAVSVIDYFSIIFIPERLNQWEIIWIQPWHFLNEYLCFDQKMWRWSYNPGWLMCLLGAAESNMHGDSKKLNEQHHRGISVLTALVGVWVERVVFFSAWHALSVSSIFPNFSLQKSFRESAAMRVKPTYTYSLCKAL